MARIEAVGVTSTDMQKTVAFYTCLGFDFSGVDLEADHVEPNHAPGATRLMIDTEALMIKLTGHGASPSAHSQFGLLCDSPEEVNALARAVGEAGFAVKVAPWDAFWGQRYATVEDPDGHKIDLYAEQP